MPKYANRKKTGSKKVRSYDPKNNKPSGGGGGQPSVVSRYSPAGNDTPSAPGSKKKIGRGRSY